MFDSFSRWRSIVTNGSGWSMRERCIRVKYHSRGAGGGTETPQVTTKDLLRPRAHLRPVQRGAFRKTHPQLVQKGNTPFGKAEANDICPDGAGSSQQARGGRVGAGGIARARSIDLFELSRKKLLNDCQAVLDRKRLRQGPLGAGC